MTIELIFENFALTASQVLAQQKNLKIQFATKFSTYNDSRAKL